MPGTLKIAAERALYENVDNEVIIIDIQTGNYYHLTGSGQSIWLLLQQQPTSETIIAAFEARFPSQRPLIADAIQQFVQQLKDAALVTDADDVDEPPTLSLDMLPADAVFKPPQLTTYTNMSDLLLLDPIHDVDDKGWPHKKPIN